jgi:hypothetical protein
VRSDPRATGSSILPLDGGNIYVHQDGPVDAQALVLIHGTMASTHHAFIATSRAAVDYLTQRALPDRLTALGTPLLVIFGEEDRRWRSSSAADYRAVPGASVELLPGVGHTPILEDPPRTAALLLAFIAIHTAQEG